MDINSVLQRVSNQATRRIAIQYGSSVQLFPLVEYPKSGGTWVCRMLAESIGLPFAQFSRMPVAMPSVTHGHWKYHPRMQNTTYLMRDGRDVMVSFYFHHTRKAKSPNLANQNMFIDQMYKILGPRADIFDIQTNLSRFIKYMFANPSSCKQNWVDHNRAWMGHSHVSYIKYEDLKEDCVSTMEKLVESLGHEPNTGRIERVVDKYSMKNMTGRDPGQEDSKSFIRKGIVGDWKNHFTPESAQVFHDLAGDVLIELGYERDASWVEQVSCPQETS